MSEERKKFVGGKALLDAEPAPRRPLMGFGVDPSPPAVVPQPPQDPPPAPATESRPTLSSQPAEPARGGPVSSQPVPGSQPATSSQAIPSRPTLGSLLNVGDQPTVSSQPSESSQPGMGLLSTIPEVDGHTTLPHRYTDHVCRWLSPDEQAVYTQLYRLSWGWGKETCFISNPRLSERSNVPLSTMKRVLVKLIAKRLIEKTGGTQGYGKEQGVEFKVFRVSSQPNAGSRPAVSRQPVAGTIKDKDLKENDKGQVCLLCKDTSGFIYVDKGDPSKGVSKCRHVGLRKAE